MRLAAERSGDGRPIVLLHGLTATRRYVVMGSTLLQRSGFDVLAYDARGHGESDPAPDPAAYTYADLCDDLAGELHRAGLQRVWLAGVSMGAHTAVRFALDHPERVAGLVLITPAFLPGRFGAAELARWDARAEGLRHGGVDGFLAAYDELDLLSERDRAIVTQVVRQRLALHRHPAAVADALSSVPRSSPFADLADLAAVSAPALVVADRDDVDPGHPLAVAEAWARTIPRAEIVVEAPGERPIAWRGGELARRIVAFAGADRPDS